MTALASSSEIPGVKMTPPLAPVTVSISPIPDSSKAFLIMAISSEIEEFAA